MYTYFEALSIDRRELHAVWAEKCCDASVERMSRLAESIAGLVKVLVMPNADGIVVLAVECRTTERERHDPVLSLM